MTFSATTTTTLFKFIVVAVGLVAGLASASTSTYTIERSFSRLVYTPSGKTALTTEPHTVKKVEVVESAAPGVRGQMHERTLDL
jgi:hypothetical protein